MTDGAPSMANSADIPQPPARAQNSFIRVVAIAVGALSIALPVMYMLAHWSTDVYLSLPHYALIRAIDSGDVAAVRAQLQNGVNPNELPTADDEAVAPLCASRIRR